MSYQDEYYVDEGRAGSCGIAGGLTYVIGFIAILVIALAFLFDVFTATSIPGL